MLQRFQSKERLPIQMGKGALGQPGGGRRRSGRRREGRREERAHVAAKGPACPAATTGRLASGKGDVQSHITWGTASGQLLCDTWSSMQCRRETQSGGMRVVKRGFQTPSPNLGYLLFFVSPAPSTQAPACEHLHHRSGEGVLSNLKQFCYEV